MRSSGGPAPSADLTVEQAAEDFESLFSEQRPAKQRAAAPGREGEPEEDDGYQPNVDNAAIDGDEAEEGGESDDAEAEGEPEEGEESAEEPETQEVDEQELLSLAVPVVVDGEVKQIPVADLTKSYLQQADYTRKTQALAEDRKLLDSHRSAWAEQTQQLGEQLDVLIPALVRQYRSTELTAQQLNELKETDPGRWSAYMHERRQQIDLMQQAQSQRAALRQGEELQKKQQREAAIPVEMRSLLALDPDFRTPKGEFNYEHYDAVGKFLLGKGIRPEEWDDLYDHRMLHIASLAMKAERAARKTKRAQPRLLQLAKPIRSGRQAEKASPRQLQRRAVELKERALKRTGSVRDAAALFEHYIE